MDTDNGQALEFLQIAAEVKTIHVHECKITLPEKRLYTRSKRPTFIDIVGVHRTAE
jgi:hypothetical protein